MALTTLTGTAPSVQPQQTVQPRFALLCRGGAPAPPFPARTRRRAPAARREAADPPSKPGPCGQPTPPAGCHTAPAPGARRGGRCWYRWPPLRSSPLVPGGRWGEPAEGSGPRRAGQGRAGRSLPQRCAEAAAVAAARRVGSGGRLLLLLAGRSMAVKVTLPLRRLLQEETGGHPPLPPACPLGAAGAGGGGRREEEAAAAGAPRGEAGGSSRRGRWWRGGPGEGGQRSLTCLRPLRRSGGAAGGAGPAGGGPLAGGRWRPGPVGGGGRRRVGPGRRGTPRRPGACQLSAAASPVESRSRWGFAPSGR